MAGLVKLVFQEYGFDAGDLGLFEDLKVCDEVAPEDVEDGVKTMLMEVLEESKVAPVGHPHLGAVEKGGENYSSVGKDLGFVVQVPKPLFGFSKPVFNFFVYRGV